jgi:membrane dipeptidase
MSFHQRLVSGLLSWILATATGSDLLHGQDFQLSGRISDSYTGLPVDSALVEIIAKPSGRRNQVYTNANGEWQISVATSVRGNPAPVPSGFHVFPNAPNPFRPPTQLRFVVSRPGRVEIALFNLLGQKLDALTADLHTAGEYAVSWGGKGGQGILFYAITMNGERLTGKMVQLAGGNTGLGNIMRRAPTANLPKTTQQEFTFIVSKFFYESDTLTQNLSGDTRLDFVLETVHRRAIVIDLHNDVLGKVVENNYQLGVRNAINHSDLPRFRDGGMDIQLLSIWIDPAKYPTTAYQQALKFVDALKDQIARNPNDLMQVRQAAELEQALAQKKLIGILAVEGGHAIENSLVKLKEFYAHGARYLTITWNNSPSWAVSGRDSRSATVGLNDFGRQVIQTMDSLGMIIDVSHTGIKTIEDILTITKNPIVATHSGARALVNNTRNLSDDQIRKIAATGGVIGVPFYPFFLTGSSRATVNDIVRHADYIAKLVGVDYVAIGSDFDGIEVAPTDLNNVAKLPLLTEALLRKGYSPADVRKMLGENFLRVFRKVCK